MTDKNTRRDRIIAVGTAVAEEDNDLSSTFEDTPPAHIIAIANAVDAGKSPNSSVEVLPGGQNFDVSIPLKIIALVLSIAKTTLELWDKYKQNSDGEGDVEEPSEERVFSELPEDAQEHVLCRSIVARTVVIVRNNYADVNTK